MKNGFTLVELVVAVSLAAILLAVGAPSFQQTIANNRLAIQTNNFIASMNLARSEAVKRGFRVTVCASDPAETGNSDQTKCAGSWTGGWIVITDANGNCTVDAGDERMRVQPGPSAGYTITAAQESDGTAVTCVGYSGMGTSTASNDSIQFTVCNSKLHQSRILELSRVGRLNKSNGTCS